MSEAKNFTKVSLKLLRPEIEVPCEIYVYLTEKFLKYLPTKGSFTPEQYNKFISKKIKHVYIENQHAALFSQWLKTHKESKIEQDCHMVGGKYRPMVEENQKLRDFAFEVFTDEEINRESLASLQDSSQKLIDILKEDKRAQVAILKLSQYDGSLENHSTNVANLAVYLAMVLGHTHPLVLQNIFLGALFHDYGKTKYDPDFWEKQKQSNNMYSQAEQDHPILAGKSLRKTEQFPDQVITIVEQHHEQFSGGGYPKGLQGKEIYELSRIVSIANVFDQTCQEHKGLPKDKVKKAIKILSYDNGKQFDTDLVNRVSLALEEAGKEFDKPAQKEDS